MTHPLTRLSLGLLLALGCGSALYNLHLGPLRNLGVSPAQIVTTFDRALPPLALVLAFFLRRTHTLQRWPYDQPPAPPLDPLATVLAGLGSGAYLALHPHSTNFNTPSPLPSLLLLLLLLAHTAAGRTLRRALLHLTLFTLAADLAAQATAQLRLDPLYTYDPTFTLVHLSTTLLTLAVLALARWLGRPPETPDPLSPRERRAALALTLACLVYAACGPLQWQLDRHRRRLQTQTLIAHHDVVADLARTWLDQRRFAEISPVGSAEAVFLSELPAWRSEISDLSLQGPLDQSQGRFHLTHHLPTPRLPPDQLLEDSDQRRILLFYSPRLDRLQARFSTRLPHHNRDYRLTLTLERHATDH